MRISTGVQGQFMPGTRSSTTQNSVMPGLSQTSFLIIFDDIMKNTKNRKFDIFDDFFMILETFSGRNLG